MRPWLDQLEERTRKFTSNAIEFSKKLELQSGCRNTAEQLSRAAGSVGANHRAARRAGSDRSLLAKLQIVSEEIDECVFWLQTAEKTTAAFGDDGRALLRESRELRAIFGKSVGTLRKKRRDAKR